MNTNDNSPLPIGATLEFLLPVDRPEHYNGTSTNERYPREVGTITGYYQDDEERGYTLKVPFGSTRTWRISFDSPLLLGPLK